MAKKDPIPRQDSEFIIFNENFQANLPQYVNILNLEQPVVDEVFNKSLLYKSLYNLAVDKKADAAAAINAARNQRADTEAALRTIIKDIKNKPAYTSEIGRNLNIIGAETIIDPFTTKPEISRVTVFSTYVRLDWVKGQMQAVAVFCMRLTGANINLSVANAVNDPAGLRIWERIGTDTRSPFEDIRLNLTGEPEARLYKFQYLDNDQLFGLESDIIKVIVDIQPTQ